MIPWSTY